MLKCDIQKRKDNAVNMRLKKYKPGLGRNMIKYWKFGIRELNSVQLFP